MKSNRIKITKYNGADQCYFCSNTAEIRMKKRQDILVCHNCLSEMNHNKTTFYANDKFDAKCMLYANEMYFAISDVADALRSWRKYQDYANPESLDDKILDIIRPYRFEE